MTTVPATPDPALGGEKSKGEQTRARIVDAALSLFEERGYAGTTMRAVAQEAGVSVGNAYHYFASKDQLVQGFYDRVQATHAAESARRLDGVEGLAARFAACEEAFLDVAERYHPFAGKFFAVAAEPTSPLSPFSEESAPAREASVAILRSVVDGAGAKADARLLRELPELLWLAHMGVVLHWVHDASEGQRRTRTLVRRAAPLLERLVTLSRLRPLRPVVHEVLDLVRDVRS